MHSEAFVKIKVNGFFGEFDHVCFFDKKYMVSGVIWLTFLLNKLH